LSEKTRSICSTIAFCDFDKQCPRSINCCDTGLLATVLALCRVRGGEGCVYDGKKL
jgi:hypothetical protein